MSVDGFDADNVYIVDDAGVVILEILGGGFDEVRSSLASYTLPNAVERLRLVDAAIEGLGNSSDNAMFGTALDNTLRARTGNDTINGGLGDDLIDGGSGYDIAVFSGMRSSYVIGNMPTGGIAVSGADGIDTLENIEVLSFDDGNYRWDAETRTTVLVPDSGNGFRLFVQGSFAAKLGGKGEVFGTTQDSQWFSLGDPAGRVIFDATFNRGGDGFGFAGDAAQWQIAKSGSRVVFTKDENVFSIPFGAKFPGGFSDGTRFIAWDSEQQSLTIGDGVNEQIITEVPQPIVAPAGTFSGNSSGVGGSGALFLRSDSPAFVFSPVYFTQQPPLKVFGTNGSDYLTLWGGNVELDASFNRGGDTVLIQPIRINPSPLNATLSRSASRLVLDAGGLHLTIPVGLNPTKIDLGETSYELRFDSATGDILFGNQVIGAEPVVIPNFG